MNTSERFWKYVDKSGECWLWTGATSNGYGILSINNGTGYRYAHHIAYELAHGTMPDKPLLVIHTPECHNRHCVNPAHLASGTRKDMTANMVARGNGREGKYKLSFEQMAEVRQMYVNGVRTQEIAKRFGVSPSYVRDVVKGEFEGDTACAIVAGGRPRGRKLTYADAQTIRERYAMGVYKMRELADIYGVDLSAISLIVNGKRLNNPPELIDCS